MRASNVISYLMPNGLQGSGTPEPCHVVPAAINAMQA